MTVRQRKARQRRRNGHSAFFVALGVLGALFGIGVLAIVGYIIGVAATAPNLSELKPRQTGATSVVYAADGSRLGYVSSDIIRQPIPGWRMPQALRQATVAIEDSRFYHHGGVDWEGIVRAGLKNLESGKTVQGGSTITQQLVRALYIRDPKRTFTRKIREAKLASEFEKRHSKDWILTEYLNDIPYGTVNGKTAVGAEAAAEIYFSKHARGLTLPQAALLAGLPQAPSEYSPFRRPNDALARRNEVLRAMLKSHYLTAAEAQQAMSAPLGLKPGSSYFTRREPYFFDYVSEELIQRYGIGAYRQGGLKVYTTIEPKLQEEARSAMKGQLYLPGDPASATVAIDPSNGYIRAMTSTGTYKQRNFNLAAQGHRQPGSAFKVFVLTTAIKRGVNPDSTSYDSKPLALPLSGGQVWHVKTYDNSYAGRISLTRATLRSDNTVYAQLDLDLGPKSVAATAKQMGITTQLDGLPAEGLGGLRLGVSPLEMADAYATLASGGIRHKPIAITKVVFPDGKSDNWGRPEAKRVFSDGVAYEVTKILKMNVQQGTGTAANFGCPAAGKTGTTDNFNDAWFVGYTPKLTAAVWVGYPNALIQMRSVHGIEVAGGTFPAQIWHDFMSVAHGGFCGDFSSPTNPVSWVPFNGKYARGSAPSASSSPYGYHSPYYRTPYHVNPYWTPPSNGSEGAPAPQSQQETTPKKTAPSAPKDKGGGPPAPGPPAATAPTTSGGGTGTPPTTTPQ